MHGQQNIKSGKYMLLNGQFHTFRCPLNRRVFRLRNQSRPCGEKKYFIPAGASVVQHVVFHCINYSAPASTKVNPKSKWTKVFGYLTELYRNWSRNLGSATYKQTAGLDETNTGGDI
jgi:hypothetical protein